MHILNNLCNEFNVSFCLGNSNDIALIKLESAITPSNTITPTCLPADGHVLPHNAPCYVTGWGRLYSK